MGCWRVEGFPTILEGSHSMNLIFGDQWTHVSEMFPLST
jgi:hypothetical protein